MPSGPELLPEMVDVERSVLLWKLPAGQIPTKTGSIANLSIDFSGDPDLQELLGPDQHVVSPNLTPLLDGDFLLLLERRPSLTHSRDTAPGPATGAPDPA